jgi:prepilin-type processing-associated H-X9-DG protein
VILIGEKHLRPADFLVCDAGDGTVRDCSYFYSAGGHQEFGNGRHIVAMTRVLARGPADDPGGQGNVTRHRAFGSAHPGVINFAFGDGSIRGLSTSTPTDSGDNVNVDINTNMSIFTKLVHPNDGFAGSL